MLLAIHFARLGPYHAARLRSACEVFRPLGWRVLALEIAGLDTTYAWEQESGRADWGRVTVFPEGIFENIRSGEMRRGIERELNCLRPDAVAIAGWGTVDARVCLDWCKRNDAKAIVMSETRAADGRRVWWKEWVKSRIVRRFDAALCGGESHKRYLLELGIPEERIAFGYNVVDNEFFSDARNSKPEKEKAGHLPLATATEVLEGPYFLASNRFVERKNLGRLLEGYKIFLDLVGKNQGAKNWAVWPLVLLGDGELRAQLEERCAKLGVQFFSSAGHENLKLNSYKLKTPPGGGLVVFSGFRQIGELPSFYAGAGAFVHPALEEPWGLVINEAMASGLPVLSSHNVGAAEELVVEGETGFLFDPKSANSMAECLLKVFALSEARRGAMGLAAREMVERKVPKRAFGEGLAKLVLGDEKSKMRAS